MKATTDLYLTHVEGDVFLMVLGPFSSEEERLEKARELRRESSEDGVYILNITDGKPSMDCFSAREVDPNCLEKE